MNSQWRFLPALLLLLCLLVACGNASTSSTGGGGPLTSSSTQSQTNTPAQTGSGTFQEFALPQDHSGLMRPVVDAQGNVWFGEMSRNYLASFDPQNKKFWQ